jgi:hypothetical protein
MEALRNALKIHCAALCRREISLVIWHGIRNRWLFCIHSSCEQIRHRSFSNKTPSNSSYWDADSRSDSKESPGSLWNPNVCYRARKTELQVPVFGSHYCSPYPQSYFLQIGSNIVIPSDFTNSILYKFLIFSVLVTQYPVLNWSPKFGENTKYEASHYVILFMPPSLPLFMPPSLPLFEVWIFPSALSSSDTLNLCSSLRSSKERGRVSRSYKTTGQIIKIYWTIIFHDNLCDYKFLRTNTDTISSST